MYKVRIKAIPWGDEWYYGHYIRLEINDKWVWESSWHEERDPDELRDLREQVKGKLDDLINPVKYDLSSDYVYEWKIVD